MDETDEIDILGCSDEDCAKVEVNFLTKDSDKGVHTTEERKEKEFGDCYSIESSHDYVLQMFEAEALAIDTLIQSREPYILKIDSRTDNMLSTDSVRVRLNIYARQLDSHPVIEQCIKGLVKKITDDLDGDVPSDELNIVTHQTLPFKSVKKPSSDVQVKSDGTNYENVETDNQKLKMSDFSPSDELKMKQLKKALKDIDLLSSCTEEIGRMNEIFKTEVLKMLSELMVIRRLTRYVQENLAMLDDLPSCTMLFHVSDRLPRGMVNVFEFGVSLLNDLTKLFLNFQKLLLELNEYRLKFINLSETFCVNPFELHVGESQNSVLDVTFAAAIKIYKEYFENDTSWDILHEHFVSEHQVLQGVRVKFDSYIDKLGALYGAN